jgi:predicted short-subunit dehydrogenase-like oxidoreductase (DUF2520 family)
MSVTERLSASYLDVKLGKFDSLSNFNLLNFNIIGAGRLGQNLALSLLSATHSKLVNICNRTLQSAHHATNEIGAGQAVAGLVDLSPVRLTFITAPDDDIPTIASRMANGHKISSNEIFVHCSGVLSSEVLTPLQQKGGLIASIHPMKAFRKKHISADAFQKCDCAIEGDDAAVQLLISCFTQMGANVFRLNPTKKKVYHAAAVMASNYMVTLAGCAVELLLEAGLTEREAQLLTQHLMSNTLSNLQHVDHVNDALTGPLMRGDVGTIKEHLRVLQSPHIHALYKVAGRATLPLVDLDETTMGILRDML